MLAYNNSMARPVGTRTPLSVRLWRKVDTSAGPSACWPWTGSRIQVDGKLWYGQIQDGGLPGVSRSSKLIGTHRAAWIVTNGPIPDDAHVLHRCDNPPCCNPAHLFLGTPLSNVADMIEKGRARMEGTKPTLVQFTCEFCGREVTVPKTQLYAGTRRFCSRSCASKATQEAIPLADKRHRQLLSVAARKRVPHVKKTCEICGTPFEVIPSKAERTRYCSKPCRLVGLHEGNRK